MTDLAAIVKATRASANALDRMQRYGRRLAPMHAAGNRVELRRAYDLARRDYERAQAVLAANPLPGDRT